VLQPAEVMVDAATSSELAFALGQDDRQRTLVQRVRLRLVQHGEIVQKRRNFRIMARRLDR
jgi:hypothetical protein